MLFVVQGLGIGATSFSAPYSIKVWGAGEMLPPNWFWGSKVESMNCAQFVLFVLQGFKICAISPSSLLAKFGGGLAKT